jgi:uncharacterized membrane protein AbrB (regulator of aidB expression)
MMMLRTVAMWTVSLLIVAMIGEILYTFGMPAGWLIIGLYLATFAVIGIASSIAFNKLWPRH